MELADSADPFDLPPDRRLPMPEPPPVRLVAVADVTVPAAAGAERALDDFYVELLKFERQPLGADGQPFVTPPAADDPAAPHKRPLVEQIPGFAAPKLLPARASRPLPPVVAGTHRGPVYRAENHRLCVEVREPPIYRETLRPVGVEVKSLPVLIAELNQRELEHTRQRGLTPGQDSVLLQDPAGNWVEVREMRPI